jgi:hypothetical protein
LLPYSRRTSLCRGIETEDYHAETAPPQCLGAGEGNTPRPDPPEAWNTQTPAKNQRLFDRPDFHHLGHIIAQHVLDPVLQSGG